MDRVTVLIGLAMIVAGIAITLFGAFGGFEVAVAMLIGVIGGALWGNGAGMLLFAYVNRYSD